MPAMIQADASRPLRLVIVNEGREPHQFSTPLLSDPRVRFLSKPHPAVYPGDSLRILPGQSVEVTLLPPPGTYLFRCLIRGHAGMQGTIVVS